MEVKKPKKWTKKIHLLELPEVINISQEFLYHSCFVESFHFHHRFKGFINKMSYSLYTNKQYKCLLENYLTYFQYAITKRKEKQKQQRNVIAHTSPNWDQIASRFKQRWEAPRKQQPRVSVGKRYSTMHPPYG